MWRSRDQSGKVDGVGNVKVEGCRHGKIEGVDWEGIRRGNWIWEVWRMRNGMVI